VPYRKLADVVFWFHLVWAALLIGGSALQFVFPWYKPIQMVILTVTIASQILFLGCPIVGLENALRRKYDPSKTYTGSFVCHCLKKWFGIDLPPMVIFTVLIVLLAISIVIWLR
jgi:hypothetical protein